MLATLAFAVAWPGVATYDGVVQYRQALTGLYDDWHPPAMARLWAMLRPLGAGTWPMLVVQLASYWAGLGGIAGGLGRAGRPRSAAAVLAVGATPLFAGWQGVVLKDTQLLGAMLAAIGLVAWWRLPGRRVPWPALAVAGVLLGYALLVRANAMFAVVPLAATLWPARPGVRTIVGLAAAGAVLVLAPAINHRLLDAAPTPVARTLPVYDLAGIARFAPGEDSSGLLPAERALIATRACYQPFFWDPLGTEDRCGPIAARLWQLGRGELTRDWLAAIVAHPLAYALHRSAHLNSTERLWVPARWPNGGPPAVSEPNDLGLGSPGRAAYRLALLGEWQAESPFGWPVVWIVVAATGLWVAARRPPGPARDLALALGGSALALEASFAAISIASDLRYHLWPMLASALMAVLLADRRPRERLPLIVGGALLAAVTGTGTVARLILPAPPTTYVGMLAYR